MNLPRERDENLLALLRICEDETPYEIPVRHLSSDGREVVIISDLHMSEGRTPAGTYEGTENFFADESFRRLLESLADSGDRSRMLVLNGDVIDFLRVVSVPETDDDFVEWGRMLHAVGLEEWTPESLKERVTDREREFGLKTHDFKSVWKLDRAMQGHPPVFDALAEWIYDGNFIVILKGNHDLEWYWRLVRDYLRLALSALMTGRHPEAAPSGSLKKVLDNLAITDDVLLIDGAVYVEHGHR
jgi:hypothetical protein